MMITQAELINRYTKTNRPRFNPDLFNRTDDDIINVLKQVILSSQRNSYAIIHVKAFTVIEDYDTVREILREDEERRQKNNKKLNVYNYIDLKDSDIKLLQVDYYISAQGEAENLTVYIAIPRIVNKYYFRIGGNDYYAMYQVVDNSTYNNSTAKSKKHVVTLKTMSTPLRIYRDAIDLHTIDGKKIRSVHYTCRVFSKQLSTLLYIFAKLGLYDALEFCGLDCIRVLNYLPENDPLYDANYIFRTRSEGLYIVVPKDLFDADYFVQSVVSLLATYIRKNTKYPDLFTNQYWMIALGLEYNNATIEKGMAVLTSLESIYDIITYRSIRLPVEEKQTIYHIIRWMCREFSNLRIKDNLDVGFKKIRIAEYIASIYVAKLSKGIYRLADAGANVTIQSIKKSINIMPLFLLVNISRCNLVNYKNGVNDLDSVSALKFTYKGISGIANDNTKSVPDIYRAVNISHIGRIDLDTSSATDPGMTGIICPLVKLYGDMAFSDVEEPNSWESTYKEIADNFKALHGLKDVIQAEKRLISIPEDPIRQSILSESIFISEEVLPIVKSADESAETVFADCTLEGSGLLESSVVEDSFPETVVPTED